MKITRVNFIYLPSEGFSVTTFSGALAAYRIFAQAKTPAPLPAEGDFPHMLSVIFKKVPPSQGTMLV
jgi:hypothetical protein